MQTTDSKPFRKAIRRTLVHHAGGSSDARTIAEATLSTWNQMSARLTPAIGARGADILFRRSLQLTSSTNRWLAVSEGIETQKQLAFLKSHHCAEGQGYYFGRPMSADKFTNLLVANQH